ncbi:MAG TPA: hypothetical protein VFG83_04010, partial [Kofleriaceae bacterium]|nr:hypothetical protein [Kofleriaceae bacterium]
PVAVQAAEDEPVTVQAAEDEPVTVQAAEDEPVAAKAAPATRTRARKRSAKSHTRRHPREDNTDRSRGHIDSLDFDSSNTRSGVDSLGF